MYTLAKSSVNGRHRTSALGKGTQVEKPLQDEVCLHPSTHTEVDTCRYLVAM